MSNHIHRYSKLQDVIYGSSDVLFFKEVLKFYNNQKIDRFVSVVGGMSFLNFIALFCPQETILFDINSYVLKYCKLILRIIFNSKTKEDFLNSLEKGEYQINDEDESHMREILKYMGKSKPEETGPGWSFNIPDNGPLMEKSEKKRGIQLGHPLRSWKFALENFSKLKENLEKTKIETFTLNIFDKKFNEIINKEMTWVHFSNIFQVAFHNNWMDSHSFFLNEPKQMVLLDETAPVFEITDKGLLKITRTKEGWKFKKICKL